MDLEKICSEVRQLAIKTGDFIYNERENLSFDSIVAKGANDFVTHVDKGAEERIISGLQKIFPEAGFIAEEDTSAVKKEKYNWVIDPLDGTTNFIHSQPPYAVSIALMDKKEVILGVVYEITMQECFYAWKGSKAYLNGHEIKTSKIKKVKDGLIATGFPYNDFIKIKSFMASLEYLFNHSHGVRRLGSAATDMVYVACGRFEAFYEYGLSPWDVAAACLILQQAGGKVGDFKGGNDYIFGEEIIATNGYVFEEFSEIIRKYMLN
ncbi:MAG: inositol monophosphatase family protein [Bacteroidota bacterium]